MTEDFSLELFDRSVYVKGMDEVETRSQDEIRAKRAINVYWTLAALLGITALVFLSMIPVPRTARNAARRTVSQNNLKLIGLALHNYLDAEQSFPDEAIGQSWATQLLPYLDESPLYDAMDLSKPWNDPANDVATKQTVQILSAPYDFERFDPRGYALSHYAGNSQWLAPGKVHNFSDVKDGVSSTILAGEAGDGFMPWAEPGNLRDPSLGFNSGLGSFGHPRKGGGVLFLMGDGRVILISNDVDPTILKALSTPAGGETIPEDY